MIYPRRRLLAGAADDVVIDGGGAQLLGVALLQEVVLDMAGNGT